MTENTNQKIDSFVKRPFYQIHVKSSGVNFDIRVNDLPVFRFFEKSGGTNMEYPINTAILNSGKQILKVKVTPVEGRNMILPNNTFTLEVNKKDDAWVFDNKREIVLEMPKMIIPESGLPYWEFRAEFDAEVPYNLVGWKKSERIDSMGDIQKMLFDSYEKIKKSIENKDNKEFVRLTNGKVNEEAVSLYEKQEDAIGFQNEKEIVLPMNDCQIKFYGNGKLVRLETKNGESC